MFIVFPLLKDENKEYNFKIKGNSLELLNHIGNYINLITDKINFIDFLENKEELDIFNHVLFIIFNKLKKINKINFNSGS